MLFTISPAAMPDGYGEALLSLAAAKQWLRVETEDEDLLIADLRDAAIDLVEQTASEFLRPRTGAVITFPGFGADMRLHRGPNAQLIVTAVAYVDSEGEAAALDAGNWRVSMGKLVPALNTSWPSSYGDVTVTFDGGYPAGACPPRRRLAVKQALAFLYLNRDAALSDGIEGPVPPGVAALCDAPVLI